MSKRTVAKVLIGHRVRIGDVGRAQRNEGEVAGVAVDAHDTCYVL